MSTQLAAVNKPRLVERLADRFGVDADKLLSTLRATAFRVKDGEVSNEQMMALLVVAEQYGLNPFTKELYAFPDKNNGIIPIVSVDGWNRIAQQNPHFDGESISFSEKLTNADADAKLCPEWVDVMVYRKDTKYPTVHREYLDECYRPAFTGTDKHGKPYKKLGPWQSHTKRMLEWKARIQARRIAFGFAGIYDEDEGLRIRDMGNAEIVLASEFITAEQAADLTALLKEVGGDPVKLCEYFKIDKVENLPAQAYQQAVALTEARRK